MISPLHFIKYLIFIMCLLPCFSIHAFNSDDIEKQANLAIKELYHTLNTMQNASMVERINWISNRFKGSIYLLGSLGEGPQARYDQFPTYRVDAFDCDTYVNTVLALALGTTLETFQQCLKFSRYKDGKQSYLNRNHFTSLDWNANNQLRGVLQDITTQIVNENNQPVAQLSKTLINKASWFARRNTETIRLAREDTLIQEKRLAELVVKGSTLEVDIAVIPYIPLEALFLKNNQPNLFLFSQIPNGSIIEIVRPNWDLRQQIGTSLDVSHLGFAIWDKEQLYFREASSQYGKVVDVLLIDYLKEARNSPTIKGINIQIIVPKKPVTGECRYFKNTNATPVLTNE